ncbi:MAG: hypothetical protein CR972_03270 [Candidatus Moraniibacteriota bacterium]|nr:MAG: hypothetical protein CR972_03270 [Candidatus Moranbacteria bacterium]
MNIFKKGDHIASRKAAQKDGILGAGTVTARSSDAYWIRGIVSLCGIKIYASDAISVEDALDILKKRT